MLRDQYDVYIAHMTEVRQLSSPNFGDLNAESYGELLAHNFRRIGELAAKNRDLLRQEVYPLLDSDGALSPEVSQALFDFSQQLIDASYVESLDAPMVARIVDRLAADALRQGNDDWYVEQLDAQIVAFYTLLSMAIRITSAPQIAASLRDAGLDAAERLLRYLEPEAFLGLSPASRELVLTNARYATVLFEATVPTPDQNERELAMLDRALALANDPFYHDNVPDFDWNYYLFRTLEYYAMLTDVGNVRAFDAGQLARIGEKTEQLRALWYGDPELYGQFASKGEVDIIVARNRYLAGAMGLDKYQDELLRIYTERERDSFDVNGAYQNLLAPLEYMLTLRPGHLSERYCAILRGMYESICLYAFEISNKNCLGFVLEYFSLILENFLEVPGEITFEDMGIRCLAALHPPTYAHSMMVGLITRCLVAHLVHLEPERFVRLCGCDTTEEVLANTFSIVDFAYHAAVCHDFGKLPLIDTILVYGRDLLDFEFGLIREHPAMGARMLARHVSTREFVPVARLHHRWHDGSRGYPAVDGAEVEALPTGMRTLLELVTCADCMDAATDSVGRSYQRGKTLDDYLAEVAGAAGTWYAPYLPELLARPEVRAELEYLLSEGRSANYRRAFLLLRDVRNAGE